MGVWSNNSLGVEVGVAEPVPESVPPVIGPEPIVVSVGEAVPPGEGEVVAAVPVFVFVSVPVLVGVTDAVFVSVFVFEIVGPPGVVVTVGVTVTKAQLLRTMGNRDPGWRHTKSSETQTKEPSTQHTKFD